MNINLKFENVARRSLCKYLSKLNPLQFKIFYSIFVHYWVSYKYFFNKQNLFNLWCELNRLCHELDESFPDEYDNKEEIASFCKSHPYYFIDKLPINIIASLFADHIDDRIDILTNVAKILYETDIRAAYTYANKALGLNEPIDILVSQTQALIKRFS